MLCFQNLPLRSFTISPKGHSLLVRKTRTGRWGGLWWSLAAARLRAMELITILNRYHRFPGFVYQQAHLQEEHRSRRATAQGFDRSLLALPFAGARLRPTRRTA